MPKQGDMAHDDAMLKIYVTAVEINGKKLPVNLVLDGPQLVQRAKLFCLERFLKAQIGETNAPITTEEPPQHSRRASVQKGA